MRLFTNEMMTQLMPVSETLPKLWLVFNLIGLYGRVAEDLASFIIALVSPEVISACFQYLLRPEGVQPAPVHRLR